MKRRRSAFSPHLVAACLFAGLAAGTAWLGQITGQSAYRIFSLLSLPVTLIALLLHVLARRNARAEEEDDACNLDNMPSFPEGQAKLIDSGRLPNRYNPRINLKEFEVCHFYVPTHRLIFAPLPDELKLDPTRLVVRFSGGSYYYIVRPQEILLPADPDETIAGELVITNQRIIFLAAENGFEVPLQSLKLLDCSAHLVDFQVRNRRFTLQTEAACYAEKVLMLLLQPKG